MSLNRIIPLALSSFLLGCQPNPNAGQLRQCTSDRERLTEALDEIAGREKALKAKNFPPNTSKISDSSVSEIVSEKLPAKKVEQATGQRIEVENTLTSPQSSGIKVQALDPPLRFDGDNYIPQKRCFTGGELMTLGDGATLGCFSNPSAKSSDKPRDSHGETMYLN